MIDTTTPAAVTARRMIFGQLLSRAVCAAAELGLSDLLEAGPRSVDSLAASTGAEPRRLAQLLRSLVAFDVYAVDDDGIFRLAPVGAAMCTGARGSALPTALLAAREIGTAWNDLASTVRAGRPAFDTQHGASFFEHLDADPGLRDLFDRSQDHDQQLEIDHLLDVGGFDGHGHVVDVGGGDGALLVRLLRSYPESRATLFDLPGVAGPARLRMAREGLAGRCEVEGGDFFRSVPPGGDLYVLRQILHDWDDERARTVLARCRDAMAPGGTVMIVDRVVGDGATSEDDRFAALMDLYMMTVLGGEERSEAGLRQLFEDVGLTVRDVHRLPTATAVIEAVRG